MQRLRRWRTSGPLGEHRDIQSDVPLQYAGEASLLVGGRGAEMQRASHIGRAIPRK